MNQSRYTLETENDVAQRSARGLRPACAYAGHIVSNLVSISQQTSSVSWFLVEYVAVC